ncbi:DUF3047 domain-containing protein [uncultured Piscinibacter sp.]|uniref:DUF3047 domain-containing protein n=1 Tax=uncultured Piscinibacter sp. TaxID=1131835 RepID=UPI00260EC245|nr:DUF3047 domain-containing protein [uncultured Piscinibacter sp.]
MHRSLVALAVASLAACTSVVAPTPTLHPGDRGPWAAWQDLRLPGKRSTVYRTQRDGDRIVVHAEADGSASMLRRQVRIDAAQPLRVQFSWRVARLIEQADLGDADASDSPARLVFAFDGDHARLSQRNRMLFELAQALTGESPPYATLMYAWDPRAVAGSVISAPRSDRVRKIVLESGTARVGQWLHYERDLQADFRRAFGEDPGTLIGVALMTDADNTASRSAASYGEVRLIGRDGAPL